MIETYPLRIERVASVPSVSPGGALYYFHNYPGSDDYVDLPFQGDATSSYSIIFWFRTSGVVLAEIVDLRSDANVGATVRILAGGQIRGVHNTSTATTFVTYNDGEWHRAALSWDSTSQDLTLDLDSGGESVTAGSVTGALAPTANGRIGARSYVGPFNDFAGDLANVRITLDATLQWGSVEGDETNDNGSAGNGTLVGTISRGSTTTDLSA